MGVTHFCEWFGGQAPFIDDGRPWPPRCRALLERRPEVAGRCAPAGHALYSTDARVLQDARQWCRLKGRPFALHLAESEDETRLLLDGEGPLWACYRGMVLPEDWAVPHLRPVAYARRLDLLGPGTLAVHGVQLEPAEVTALAASGQRLCLCPRSNEYLAVGTRPWPRCWSPACCAVWARTASALTRIWMCVRKLFFCAKGWTLPRRP